MAQDACVALSCSDPTALVEAVRKAAKDQQVLAKNRQLLEEIATVMFDQDGASFLPPNAGRSNLGALPEILRVSTCPKRWSEPIQKAGG
jgi:hypothetical protein